MDRNNARGEDEFVAILRNKKYSQMDAVECLDERHAKDENDRRL